MVRLYEARVLMYSYGLIPSHALSHDLMFHYLITADQLCQNADTIATGMQDAWKWHADASKWLAKALITLKEIKKEAIEAYKRISTPFKNCTFNTIKISQSSDTVKVGRCGNEQVTCSRYIERQRDRLPIVKNIFNLGVVANLPKMPMPETIDTAEKVLKQEEDLEDEEDLNEDEEVDEEVDKEEVEEDTEGADIDKINVEENWKLPN